MRNTNKKGFTIVELVIVVAVIAILAAVLIPTFAGIIRQANIASDTALAKNLNTALAMGSVEEKPESFAEALSIIADNGYIVEKLNPTANGNFFAWDETTNQILYLDENFNVVYPEGVSGKIEDNKWHVAICDIALYSKVAAKTNNVLFLGASVSKGENHTIDLTGQELKSEEVLAATPIQLNGGSLSIKGGSISAAGVSQGADKMYDISIVVGNNSNLALENTVLSGIKTSDNGVETVTFDGGNGTLTNVSGTCTGGTVVGVYAGSEVNFVNGTYSVKDYTFGALFVSGNGSNETGNRTFATVTGGTYTINNNEYLFTVYGSQKGATLVLDGATIKYDEIGTNYFYIWGDAVVKISNDTTFNGTTASQIDWAAKFGAEKVTIEGDYIIIKA